MPALEQVPEINSLEGKKRKQEQITYPARELITAKKIPQL